MTSDDDQATSAGGPPAGEADEKAEPPPLRSAPADVAGSQSSGTTTGAPATPDDPEGPTVGGASVTPVEEASPTVDDADGAPVAASDGAPVAATETTPEIPTDVPAVPPATPDPPGPADDADDTKVADDADDTKVADDADDTKVADDEPEPADSEPSAEDEGSRRTVMAGVAVLAVALVGILIAVLSTSGGDSGSSSAPTTVTTRPPPSGPTLPAAAFTTFHDDATGFTIQFPTSWKRAQAPVSEIRLVVTEGQGQAVSVRVNTTEQVTTPENLANLKSVTDGTIATNPSARVLKTDAITLNGLIGYYYLYTFKDTASGLEGVHAHYFLFRGHNMYSIVFQAMPTERFTQYSGIFDQMAQSFKVDAEPPSPTAPH